MIAATVFFHLIFIAVANCAEWNYGNRGPDHWAATVKACAGNKQSPIDILDKNTSAIEMDGISLNQYEKVEKNAILINNGHTIQVEIPDKKRYLMRGGRLNGYYYLQQMHFHWGDSNTKGSEHLINGTAFPLEMHLVHTLSGIPLLKAIELPENTIGVLSILFHASDNDNQEIQKIVELLSSVKKRGSEVLIPELTLKEMVPKIDEFYSYDGSLTTPPCAENVIWTIGKLTLPISKKQISTFRNLLKDGKNENLWNNFRPPQSLGNRSVYTKLKNKSKMVAKSQKMNEPGLRQVMNFICNCQ